MVDIAVDDPSAPPLVGVFRAWGILALLLFVGLLSLVAVRSVRITCRDTYLASDAGQLLTTDAGQLLVIDPKSCYLAL